MFEVIFKVYVWLSNGQRMIYLDVSGCFHTERLGNQFLREQLKKIQNMNHEDIQIDVKFFERKNENGWE